MSGTWIFRREGTYLELRRTEHDEGVRLQVVRPGHWEEHCFDLVQDALAFEQRLECELLATGWRLEDYYPDRRTGIERRRHPRDAADRRSLFRRRQNGRP